MAHVDSRSQKIVRYYLHGDELEKALPCFLSAGEKAAAVYANQEALTYFGQAVEIGQTIGGTALTRALEAAQRRGWLHFSLMDCPAAIADFERMEAMARRNRDRRLEGLALAYRGWAEGWHHKFEKAERTSKAALRVAADLGNDEIRLFASIALGLFLYGTNRLTEAKPYLALSEELAKRVEDPLSQFWWGIVGWHRPVWEGRFDDALSHLAYWRETMEQRGNVFGILGNQWLEAVVLGGKGAYAEAMLRLEDALATAERIGDQFWRVRALNTIGWLYGELYDYEHAIVWNTAGVRAAQEANFPDPEVECNARLNLADNWMATGRLPEAEAQFQYVEAIVRSPRPQDHLDLWRYAQHLFHSYGELWLCRGNHVNAFEYADACLALADPGFSQKYQVKGRRLRGEVFIAQGQLAKAEHELDLALQTAVALGNPPQLWKTQARIAELRLRQGRSREARQASEAALAEIEAVGAGLMDETLRTRFLSASDVQHMRQLLD